jgi:hypothetical protein
LSQASGGTLTHRKPTLKRDSRQRSDDGTTVGPGPDPSFACKLLHWCENGLTAILEFVYAPRMTMKFFALIAVIGFTCSCIAQAQSPTPAESPAQAPTKRAHKKAQTTASPAETAAASSPAASPAGSPKARRTRKKAEAAATPIPSASPKSSFADLFKPRTSAAATSPAPAKPAPAKGASTSTKAPMGPPAAGGGHGLVWVNSETHVYHKEGSRFYGRTKKGKYMTETEAMKAGNKAAAGRE